MFLKHCEVVSRVEYFKGDIQEIIRNHTTIKKWAYALHDKDDTAPHYHLYLHFGGSGVDTKQVADWFGLQESQVCKIKGRGADALKYLYHGNDSQLNKYQYSPDIVVANFDFLAEVKASDVLGDFDLHSYSEQLEYIHSRPRGEQSSLFNDLERRWRLHCRWLSLQTDRDIDVMFICGGGGFGKTTYAKRLFKSQGYDFCTSSSSNDPFQDYLGQKGMLLDDLRDKAFDKFEDILKILDNHTNSSIQSRFQNKSFNGKLIIVTSSVPLYRWYRGKNSKGDYYNVSDEDLYQLYRRISCYVQMDENEIVVYSEVGKDGKPKGFGKCFKNDIPQTKKAEKKKTDFGAMFAKIAEPSGVGNVFDGEVEQTEIGE